MNFIIRGTQAFDTGITTNNCYLVVDRANLFLHNEIQWKIKYHVSFYFNRHCYMANKRQFYSCEYETNALSFNVFVECHRDLLKKYPNLVDEIDEEITYQTIVTSPIQKK